MAQKALILSNHEFEVNSVPQGIESLREARNVANTFPIVFDCDEGNCYSAIDDIEKAYLATPDSKKIKFVLSIEKQASLIMSELNKEIDNYILNFGLENNTLDMAYLESLHYDIEQCKKEKIR